MEENNYLTEMEDYDGPEEIGLFGWIIFMVVACLLVIPYLVIDLFSRNKQ